MTHLSHGISGRILSSMKHWFRCRIQECIRCSECDGTISPWTSHCPTCGQANPAKVSATVGIYLALGFVVVTLTLSALIINF